MRLAPTRPAPVLESVSLEQFAYSRVGSAWAVVRLLVRLRDELGVPEDVTLQVARADADRGVLSFPARACHVEQRLDGSRPTTLWRGAFALPAVLLSDERFGYALAVGGQAPLALPAPVARQIVGRALALSGARGPASRQSPIQLRRRAAALATAAAITTTSTPAAALASSSRGSSTGVGQGATSVHSGLAARALVTGQTTSSTTGSPAASSSPAATVTATTPAGTATATTPAPAPPVTTTQTVTTTPATTTTTTTTTSTTTPPAQTTSTPTVATPTTPSTTSTPTTATTDTPQPVVRSDPSTPATGTITGATVTKLTTSPARHSNPGTTGTATPTPSPAPPTTTPTHPRPADGPTHWGQDALHGSTPSAAPRGDRTTAHPRTPDRHSPTRLGAVAGSTAAIAAATPAPSSTTAAPNSVAELSPTAAGFLGPRSWTGTVTTNPEITGAVRNLAGELSDEDRPPSFLIPIYMQAARRYHVPWEVLAAINSVESDYGRDLNTSSAGAIGWMQFEPSTWKEYGRAVDGHSVANPYDPRDAIFAAARYLHAAGGATDIQRAIFAYNHASWYVDEVMARASKIAANAQFEKATTGRRGTISVFFDTGRTVRTRHGVRRELRIRYRGGVMSHYDRLIAAANMVSAADFPYLWGGGHEQPARFGPFDCSGAVSYVMQQAGYRVPTTVAGDIGSMWRFPTGPGKVTIFYNSVHTFMRIGGRFFGTSGFARPGGGAGWFEVDRLPENYLAAFHEVHVPRLGTDSFARSSGLVKRAERRFQTRANRLLDGAARVQRLVTAAPHGLGGVR